MHPTVGVNRSTSAMNKFYSVIMALFWIQAFPIGILSADWFSGSGEELGYDNGLIEVSTELVAASQAILRGDIDSPDTASALYHFRRVLEIDPTNAEATGGLIFVQKRLIERAMQSANGFDFDLARSQLDEAAEVRAPGDLVTAAQERIVAIRAQQEHRLEGLAIEHMDAGEFSASERILIDLIALGGAEETVVRLRRRLEEARVYGGFRPGEILRDHFLNRPLWAPDLVIIAAGSYVMGSPESENGRLDNEGPQHRVTFRRGFAMGVHEISVGEFREFVEATGHYTDADRKESSTVYDQSTGRLTARDNVNWALDYEGREAADDHPVVHISWNDATAYANWLSRGTGKNYRLPSESEFEYALRAGRGTKYWWGNTVPVKNTENLTGDKDSSRGRRYWSSGFRNYSDGFWGPAPVGSFKANPFGLFDMGGNVGEWVEDCWHETYMRAPMDGAAWVNPGCAYRLVRGGYWASSPDQTRSAFRLSAAPTSHDGRVGFRVIRDL